jgi:hypothetical protein
MFASGPAILSALFLIQAEVQFEAGARVETRVGQTPTGLAQSAPSIPTGQPVTVEQTQVMVVATPLLSLGWLDDVDDLRASSATRILWRPVPFFDHRPLFLELLEATHSRRLSKRSNWQLSIRGSYGEQDYSSLQQQLLNQPALPLATTMLMVDATASASWRGSRRTTLNMRLEAMHRRSFDTQTVANVTAGTYSTIPMLPTQTTVTTGPGLTYALSRRSTVEASAAIADTDSQGFLLPTGQPGKLNLLSIQPQVGIRGDLTQRNRLHVAAGFAYAVVLRGSTSQSLLPVYPLIDVDLESVLQRTRLAVVRSSLGTGTALYVDPVLGGVVSRGVVQASVDAQLGPWSVGARCAFTTDLAGRLSASAGGTPDETAVSAEIPVRYRSTRHLIVEFGGRYTERAPHLGTPGFAWHNRELWLFLNLTATSRPSSTRS